MEVLLTALTAAGRAVRETAPDGQVPAPDVGHAELTAALDACLVAWSWGPLVEAVEEAARSLEASAEAYAAVEALLVPRGLR